VNGYRVRLDGREVQCDLEGLFVLAEAGKISIDTEICQPSGAEFQRADSLIELSGKLERADPWSAWEDMEGASETWEDGDNPDSEEDDLEMDTQIIHTPLVLPLNTRSLVPILEPVLLEAKFAPIVPPAEPIEPAPPVLPEAEPPGQLIAFPGTQTRRPSSSSGGYALDDHALHDHAHRLPPPPLPDLQRSPRKPPRYTATLSYLRLGTLVGVGVLILLLARAYVIDTARTVLPPHPSTTAQGSGGDGSADVEADPYVMMESELRAQMSLDLLEATSESTFEEALLIELGRVKLDVASVRVTVVEWAGRKRDVPQSAAFRVKLRYRSGEVDRELAAVGLVVGKYIQRYSLDVEEFEVVMEQPGDGEAKLYRVDSEVARRFYIQRVALHGYLENGLKR
jgi:hypothetical protein